jgi:vancomycin resistance protein YoaR
MPLFQTSVELKEKDKKIEQQKGRIADLEYVLEETKRTKKAEIDKHLKDIDQLKRDIEHLKNVHAFEIEKAKFDKAKEMQKTLVESDMQRVEAQATLKAFKEMDTKADREHVKKIL